HDLVASADFLPRVLLIVQRARLVHVGDLRRLADLQLAAVRLLLADDHLEQRRLAGAVRADDADDAAAREREVHVLEQEPVAEPLLQVFRDDDVVAEPRRRWYHDLIGRDLGLLLFALQLLERLDARLALRLPRARSHANPLEFARQRALPRARGLLLERHAVRLLLEPARVVPLPRDDLSAVELEDPLRHIVEE